MGVLSKRFVRYDLFMSDGLCGGRADLSLLHFTWLNRTDDDILGGWLVTETKQFLLHTQPPSCEPSLKFPEGLNEKIYDSFLFDALCNLFKVKHEGETG